MAVVGFASLESALPYFREAAPKHTADDEQFFPRLCESGDQGWVNPALATLAAFEQEHRRADSFHARADMLGKTMPRRRLAFRSPNGYSRRKY
jgi:hypothetical protein